MRFERTGNDITADGMPLLTGVGDTIVLIADEKGCGVFLQAAKQNECHIWSVELGTPVAMEGFTACHRGESPFWMEPRAGKRPDEIPGDVQWLLMQRTDGQYVLLVPLIDDPLRFTLDGRNGVLRLWADSGDPWVALHEGVGAFLAVGDDPYRLQEMGAAAVQHRLQTGRLRADKPLPDFIDLFGWCTWDAFYRDVSAEKVRQGLESFRAGGVSPTLVILDDGWQSVQAMPEGGSRLTGFTANAKFPGGLAPLISAAREEYGVECFLVWHAIAGYWCGIDGQALPGYGAREIARADSLPFGRETAMVFNWQGAICAMIAPDLIAAFYDDFHRELAAQGVDGVKVDNQSSLELSTAGLGGRVRVSRAYREGLETSVGRHFSGRLINCMSLSSEMPLMATDSTVMRTSTDFWPDLPETHGAHLYANAQVGMWFGQFIHPDWDMFQSGHPMGAFHAAARAISGSPVYVSDKPDAHDFTVLRKVACSDGTVPRCTGIGRPTPDCLFHDPTREDLLLKIFNFNAMGAVVGVFHVKYDGGHAPALAGTISPRDVPGLSPGRFAVWAHRSGELRVLANDDAWPLTLQQGEWEIFTIMPLHADTAVIGLAEKYNSGGTVGEVDYEDGRLRCRVRDGGTLMFYAGRAPILATWNGHPVPISHDPATGKGMVEVPDRGEVVLEWDGA